MNDSSPVIFHIPHSSRAIPEDLRGTIALTDEELDAELTAMTDAYTEELFRNYEVGPFLDELQVKIFLRRIDRDIGDHAVVPWFHRFLEPHLKRPALPLLRQPGQGQRHEEKHPSLTPCRPLHSICHLCYHFLNAVVIVVPRQVK